MKRLALVGLLAAGALATGRGAAQAEKVGWTVGNSDKVYGSARSACEALLRETEAHGVKYVIEKMTDTEAGDQLCWTKTADDDGEAVAQTLISRARRFEFKGVQLFRGTTAALAATATSLEHDLGPGVYYTFELSAARIHAQARFQDQWAPLITAKTPTASGADLPEAVVYEYDYEAPKEQLDLSEGEARAAWEAFLQGRLGPEFEEWQGGQVNPVRYYKLLAEHVQSAYKKKPADYKAIVVFDWRIDAKLLRLNDAALVRKLDRRRMQYLETRLPSTTDVTARFGGLATPALLASCLPNAKAGSCEPMSDRLGKMLFRRYGWRPVQYKSTMTQGKAQGNHTHLRIGAVLIDATFLQFDQDAAAEQKQAADENQPYVGELFVGSAPEMIARLERIVHLKYPTLTPAELFAALWGPTPRTYTSGNQTDGELGAAATTVPQLQFQASGAIDWY